MPTVYVMGGWLPNGGALMAYEVAQIAAFLGNHDVAVISVRDEGSPSDLFVYSGNAYCVSLENFHSNHSSDDFLVLNPYFHYLLFSLSTRCRIISYVQHYTTFDFLDPGVDLYVSASQYIANYLLKQESIESVVINPFIPQITVEDHIKYEDKARSAVANFKGRAETNSAILKYVAHEAAFGKRIKQLQRGPRREILEEINKHKIFFSPTVAEGFGLLPLEAMSLGCIVVGLDAHGGCDYFRRDENSLTVPLREIRQLPRLVDYAFRNICELGYISNAAKKTAELYSYQKFRRAWNDVLIDFL